ncbi:uncharacterized protein KY384_005806 [Bacidia gigantensis]|uniref:uncharacterized protein n=1 Tax=Bacidia gigantensis TaxID=2732470 RepID=UPI001D055270|nr:uncharacterized protein KY384_005806 [Bacidia gigantensis]KAG8529171.1 hypothetical protein KY384_005806 [Bacidia gigantensis]
MPRLIVKQDWDLCVHKRGLLDVMDFLYKKLWSFLDSKSALPEGGSSDPYLAALRLWKHFQSIYAAKADQDEFKATLSQPQVRSWVILNHWWNAHLHPKKPEEDEATVALLKAAQARQDEHPENGDRAGYQSLLAHLFVAEMVIYQQIRQLDALPLSNLPPRAQQIIKQIGDKVTLARQRALKQAVWQALGQRSYQILSGGASEAQGMTHIGSTLEPCPWLRFEDRATLRRPAYLWDRQAQKSVKVRDIVDRSLKYYCVSHTWGRWRRKAIQITGVEWAVPTNSRFRVEDLPAIFQRLDWPVRYIWFDLFCIPQVECAEQAEEIGKQAEIFRQAECSVIWMHDVVGWKLLELCLSWLGLNHLHRNDPLDIGVRNCLEDLSKQLNETLPSLPSDESLNPWAPVPEDDSTSAEDVAFHKKNPGSRWFSSLWTLQEAYLRPSSLLVDRDWNFLSIGKTALITLDNLASLAYGPPSEVAESKERPKAIEVLLFTMKRWELTDLSSPSRMSLLVAAESRQSTSPRAEAIMSALGITDWFERYRKQHGKAPPQKDLVFNQYPLDFLQEAQRKIGGSFFLHGRLPQNTFQDAESGESFGTMLPLAHNPKFWQVAQAFTFPASEWTMSLTDHWEIQLDGSVIMKEAAALYSNKDELSSADGGPVTISTPEGYVPFDSFNAWASQLPEAPYRFAVAVVRYNYRQFGIILEGIESPARDGSIVLVKTAIFFTNERWCREDLVKPTPVHWRVL